MHALAYPWPHLSLDPHAPAEVLLQPEISFSGVTYICITIVWQGRLTGFPSMFARCKARYQDRLPFDGLD